MAQADPPSKRTVALFTSHAGAYETVRHMLHALGYLATVGCPTAELRSNSVSFSRLLVKFEPQVVIFDIDPPYQENWRLFGPLFRDAAMEGRGLVVSTPHKLALDHAMGKQSGSIEMLGRPFAAHEIEAAIETTMKRVQKATLRLRDQRAAGLNPLAREHAHVRSTARFLEVRMVTPKRHEPQWRTLLDISSVPAVAHLPPLVPIERRNQAARYALLRRIYREFEDVPGLSVTPGQAAKLFGLSPDVALRILQRLSDAQVLRQRCDGQFFLWSQDP